MRALAADASTASVVDAQVEADGADAQAPAEDARADPAPAPDAGTGADVGGELACSAPATAAFSLQGCGEQLLCQPHPDRCSGWVCTQLSTGHEVVLPLPRAGEEKTVELAFGSCRLVQAEGELQVFCPSEGDEDGCRPTIRHDLLPHPACLELPARIEGVSLCAEAGPSVHHDQCELVQDGCDFQLLCGAAHARYVGRATADGLQIQSGALSCRGAIAQGALAGVCSGSDQPPKERCPFQVGSVQLAESPCEETAPPLPFALTGCARDGNICQMSQRGCVWHLACSGEQFRGRARETDRFEFRSSLGADCVAGTGDGGFAGRCEWTGESCEFRAQPPEPGGDCPTVPPLLSLSACGRSRTCEVAQNGCRAQLRCDGGLRVYAAQVSAQGLTLSGDDGLAGCQLTAAESGSYTGQCDEKPRDCGAGSISLDPLVLP